MAGNHSAVAKNEAFVRQVWTGLRLAEPRVQALCSVNFLPHASSRRIEDPTGSSTCAWATLAHDDISKIMTAAPLPGGKVHDLPEDLAIALAENETAKAAWLDITVLARNEFICWVSDAKQQKTRERRIGRAVEELVEGKRRPCCWPGCKHRERNGE